MLKHLYRPETMNCLFRPAMELKSYGDYTKEKQNEPDADLDELDALLNM